MVIDAMVAEFRRSCRSQPIKFMWAVPKLTLPRFNLTVRWSHLLRRSLWIAPLDAKIRVWTVGSSEGYDSLILSIERQYLFHWSKPWNSI